MKRRFQAPQLRANPDKALQLIDALYPKTSWVDDSDAPQFVKACREIWPEDLGELTLSQVEHQNSPLKLPARLSLNFIPAGTKKGMKTVWTDLAPNSQLRSSLDSFLRARTRNMEPAFFGVCLFKEPKSKHSRGSEKDACLVPAFSLDIDCAEGEHASTANMPTKPQALDYLSNCCFIRPSIVVDSGGGYHAYFLLDRPRLIRDRHEIKALKKGFEDRIREDFTERGWHLDTVPDLARLLRLPGSWNVKRTDNPRLVDFAPYFDDESFEHVEWLFPDCRYPLSTFEPFKAEITRPSRSFTSQRPSDTVSTAPEKLRTFIELVRGYCPPQGSIHTTYRLPLAGALLRHGVEQLDVFEVLLRGTCHYREGQDAVQTAQSATIATLKKLEDGEPVTAWATIGKTLDPIALEALIKGATATWGQSRARGWGRKQQFADQLHDRAKRADDLGKVTAWAQAIVEGLFDEDQKTAARLITTILLPIFRCEATVAEILRGIHFSVGAYFIHNEEVPNAIEEWKHQGDDVRCDSIQALLGLVPYTEVMGLVRELAKLCKESYARMFRYFGLQSSKFDDSRAYPFSEITSAYGLSQARKHGLSEERMKRRNKAIQDLVDCSCVAEEHICEETGEIFRVHSRRCNRTHCTFDQAGMRASFVDLFNLDVPGRLDYIRRLTKNKNIQTDDDVKAIFPEIETAWVGDSYLVARIEAESDDPIDCREAYNEAKDLLAAARKARGLTAENWGSVAVFHPPFGNHRAGVVIVTEDNARGHGIFQSLKELANIKTVKRQEALDCLFEAEAARCLRIRAAILAEDHEVVFDPWISHGRSLCRRLGSNPDKPLWWYRLEAMAKTSKNLFEAVVEDYPPHIVRWRHIPSDVVFHEQSSEDTPLLPHERKKLMHGHSGVIAWKQTQKFAYKCESRQRLEARCFARPSIDAFEPPG